MRTEQYLEEYDFTIPFTEDILEFYNKPEVEITRSGKIIAKGKVTDIRFCEGGDLRIVNHKKGTDFLAFEMQINGQYYGPFNSHIKTPPSDYKDLNVFVDKAEKEIKKHK